MQGHKGAEVITPAWAAPNKGSGADGYEATETAPLKLKVAEPQATTCEIDDDADLDDVSRDLIQQGFVDADVIEAPENDLIDAQRQKFRRKIIKKVELPVTRKVKVPITTKETVEVTEMVEATVEEEQEVPCFKEIEEQYTDYEEETCYRLKEVWIKKVVPEAYTKKVSVKRTRKVQVPSTMTKKVKVTKQVPVQKKKVIEVPSFRIDEVKDTKLVEVEGWQEIELVPQLRDTGRVKINKSREIGGPQGHVYARKKGPVWDADDEHLDDLDTDSSEEDPDHTTEGEVKLDGTEFRVRKSKRRDQATSARVRRDKEQTARQMQAVNNINKGR